MNTYITEWGDDPGRTPRATSSFVLKGDLKWAIEIVGRYHDVLHRDEAVWRFHSRSRRSSPRTSRDGRTG